ncbi:MAG TPA: FHA domain-containing protein [Phototrophicaceae bacterium]|jgi:pSer/pThr/pTyr-binding forkhead associated (FHA) protein|nr:FHA domain-containing protein [Phototrophicaceae bacterium]
MAQLIMRRGPEPGKSYMLSQEAVQIGRGAKNDIIIIDNEVSREHCRLLRRDYGYEIFDLESSNGTFVNGQRVQENWALPAECIVELGDSITLEYKLHPDEADLSSSQIAIVRAEAGEAPPPSFLVVITSSQPLPAVYPLEGTVIEVGRGTTNSVIIVEPEISRNHLRLNRNEYGYIIQDTGSTNGTSLNGVMLKEPHLLQDGDVIRIGTSIVIRYTTNPQLFTSKKQTTLMLGGEREENKVPTRRRKMPSNDTLLRKTPIIPPGAGTGLTPGALTDHVMLLYARSEWENIVAPIVDRLYSAEVPVWVEQYLMAGGENWQTAMEQAQLECWLLIIIVSKAAVETEYIQRIWRYFHNREKPVILVMSENVEQLPIGANRAYQVLYDIDNHKQEAGLRQLVHTIKQLS